MEKSMPFAFALTLVIIIAGAVSTLKPVKPAKAAAVAAATISVSEHSARAGDLREVRADMF